MLDLRLIPRKLHRRACGTRAEFGLSLKAKPPDDTVAHHTDGSTDGTKAAQVLAVNPDVGVEHLDEKRKANQPRAIAEATSASALTGTLHPTGNQAQLSTPGLTALLSSQSHCSTNPAALVIDRRNAHGLQPLSSRDSRS